jgi:UDP-N-acetylmuramoyl-tripeptide--D-alanyl-D-alanine ligase
MKLAIENFAKAKEDNKILVLGAMAELGTDSLKEHQQIIAEIEKYPWKQVILVGGDFLKTKHNFQNFTTAEEAGQWLQSQQINNAYLLVKGSRSTGMEKAIAYL